MGDSMSFKFTWKISNFSALIVKKLYSDIFIAGRCKWRILIFPKGNNVDQLSIYLEVADATSLPSNWSRDAAFSLTVINQFNDNSTVRRETQHVFNAKESDWGFTSFIPLSKLKDPTARFLVNDALTIEAEVRVCSAVHYSVAEVVKNEPKLPAKEVPNSLPPKKVADTGAKVVPPTASETSLTSKPLDQTTKGVVQAVAPANDPEIVKESQAPSASPEEKKAALDVKTISKNLLTEISNRTATKVSSPSNDIPFPKPDLVHKQKEALQGFLNMSLEAIQQANAFRNIEEIILALVQHANSLQEKTTLEDLAARLAEFKESIPKGTTIVETAQARREALAGKTGDLNTRLEQRQKELISLEAKFSRLSEEEAKLAAEIKRLMTQKEELLSEKKSATTEFEKANQEASKDLEEWRSVEADLKQANTEWREAKEKQALGNVRWKLFKEDLGLGKLNIM